MTKTEEFARSLQPVTGWTDTALVTLLCRFIESKGEGLTMESARYLANLAGWQNVPPGQGEGEAPAVKPDDFEGWVAWLKGDADDPFSVDKDTVEEQIDKALRRGAMDHATATLLSRYFEVPAPLTLPPVEEAEEGEAPAPADDLDLGSMPGDPLPEGSLLFLDGCRGVYVPQAFAQRVTLDQLENVTAEQLAVLDAGPEHSDYWEVWGEVHDQGVFKDSAGNRYALSQDGDLWLIPMKPEQQSKHS